MGEQDSAWSDEPVDTGEREEALDDADMVSSVFPAVLGCGERAVGTVRVRNTGTTVWTRAEGFKLGAVDDEDPLFDSGDVRVWLGQQDSVAPGDWHEFEVDLLGASPLVGRQITDWQMVHEGVQWFGEVLHAEVLVYCEEPGDGADAPLPLPDMSHVVQELAADRPDLLASSCLADGGGWAFLDALVDRLRLTDDRWGYNWKRGVEGDPSEDVVDYHYGHGTREGSTDVYILDVIVDHCGETPRPGWGDQTQATADHGTIGRWTSRERF